MNLVTKIGGTALLAIAAIGLAKAEEQDTYWYGLGSYVDPDSSLNVDDGYGLQLGVGAEVRKWLNIEAYLSGTDTTGSPDISNITLGTDLQWHFTRDSSFRPYLFGGMGITNVDASQFSDETTGVLSGGIGFLADVFGDSNAMLRGEFRRRSYDEYGIDIDDNLYSLGIQVPFGKTSPSRMDGDGDGVEDNYDECPQTPRGVTVGTNGCENDADGDGVVDRIDQCPGTAPGVPVGDNGCALDTDADGVADHLDECPNSHSDARVDDVGCELDSDADGIVDRNDDCPATPADARVDINGCEIKDEIRLPGVNFQNNSDQLLPGAERTLRDAIATLQRNPEIRVEVAGHTDSNGAAEYNQALSARRAETVRDYLAANGVESNRLTARGYGESQPIGDNSTADGRAENRRVVLRVISN